MLHKSKIAGMLFFTLFIFIFTNTASAHCDSMEGPVVKASQKALETGNINYVLIWVRAEDEPEIQKLFDKVLHVRKLNDEAKELADMYFFETAVRIHRMGEGEPYTGIKPIGYHPEAGIELADLAIEKNSLSQVLLHIPKEKQEKVKELFTDLQSKKNYDVNDIKAGREFVAAYVHFIHYVERIYNNREDKVDEILHKH